MHSGLYMCEDRKLEAMIELIDEPFDFGEGIIIPSDNNEFTLFNMCYKSRKNLKLDYQEYLAFLECEVESQLLKTNGRTRAERRKNNQKYINKRLAQSRNVIYNLENISQERNKYNKNNPNISNYCYEDKEWRDWWRNYNPIHYLRKDKRGIEVYNEQIREYLVEY